MKIWIDMNSLTIVIVNLLPKEIHLESIIWEVCENNIQLKHHSILFIFIQYYSIIQLFNFFFFFFFDETLCRFNHFWEGNSIRFNTRETNLGEGLNVGERVRERGGIDWLVFLTHFRIIVDRGSRFGSDRKEFWILF